MSDKTGPMQTKLVCCANYKYEQYSIMVSEPVAIPCADAAGAPCSLHSAASRHEGKQLHLIKLQHFNFFQMFTEGIVC